MNEQIGTLAARHGEQVLPNPVEVVGPGSHHRQDWPTTRADSQEERRSDRLSVRRQTAGEKRQDPRRSGDANLIRNL
jgi:hypothetical protein